MVGPHAGQALLYALQDVIAREDVRTGLAAGGGRRSHQTAALAREIILGAPGADEASDALLAHAVVDRRVDIVDAGVEDGVEDGFRLPVRDVPAAGSAAQLHGAITQHGDLQARSSELPLG